MRTWLLGVTHTHHHMAGETSHRRDRGTPHKLEDTRWNSTNTAKHGEIDRHGNRLTAVQAQETMCHSADLPQKASPDSFLAHNTAP